MDGGPIPRNTLFIPITRPMKFTNTRRISHEAEDYSFMFAVSNMISLSERCGIVIQ